MVGSLRLLLVDDHDYVLLSLATGLEAYEDVRVVGTATNPKEAITLCLQLKPSVVVTDLMMAGEDQGLEVVRQIQACCPSIPVIMLTAFVNADNRERALAAGAAEFLDKADLSLERLMTTVRKVTGVGGAV